MNFQIEIGGETHQIRLEKDEKGGFFASKNGADPLAVKALLLRPGVLSLEVGGKYYRCVLAEDPEGPVIHLAGRRIPYRVNDPRSLRSRRGGQGGSDGPKSLTAPMPGRVVRVLVAAGDAVEANQPVVVIEAMKMQNELKSPKAGKVAEMRAVTGAPVAAGEVLAVIE